MDAEAQGCIELHLQLARELRAETLTVAGEKHTKQLVAVAEQYAVLRGLVGRTKRPVLVVTGERDDGIERNV